MRSLSRLALKISFLVSAVFVCAGFSHESSSGTRGGGDPDAVDFLSTLSQVSVFLQRSPSVIDHEAALRTVVLVSQLTEEMNDERLTPIRFSSEILRDASGAEKIALYTLEPLTITINRAAWLSLDTSKRVAVAALELLGLAQVANRYEISKRIFPNAVDALTRLRATGWEVTFIESGAEYATLVRPGSFENAQSIWLRPIVVSAANSDLNRTVQVICQTLGFRTAFRYDLTVPTSFDEGPSTLFDSTGSFSAIVNLRRQDPRYRVLSDLSCGY
ncbi:MAG: hypothetical protein EOP05_14510 [Proteobacteria bacterium]|nr:MAG: hypothetical protein EOP05_14510 [Pseudomonadota bacterium]